MTWYTVRLEAAGDGTYDDDELGHFHDELAKLAQGVVVTGYAENDPHARFGAVLDVEAGDIAHALLEARGRFVDAILRTALPPWLVVRAEILTEDERDAEAVQPPAIPELVGVAEAAELLDVGRQRVSALSQSPAFPEPVARLAAGPVWARADIEAFRAGWQRKPGRPSAEDLAARDATATPQPMHARVIHGPTTVRALSLVDELASTLDAARHATVQDLQHLLEDARTRADALRDELAG